MNKNVVLSVGMNTVLMLDTIKDFTHYIVDKLVGKLEFTSKMEKTQLTPPPPATNTDTRKCGM